MSSSESIEPLNDSPRIRVFRGGLSGRYFAAMSRPVDGGPAWEVVGPKFDVTDDVEELIADAG